MTLLEVLIAVVVLAIGLLGMGALQSKGQQMNVAAQVRTYATFLANQLAERMRVNRGASAAGYYDTSIDQAAYTGGAAPDCRTTSCSASQLRHYDLDQWIGQLEVSLPGGTGEVRYHTVTYASVELRRRYKISITWNLLESEQENETDPAQTKTMTWVITP